MSLSHIGARAISSPAENQLGPSRICLDSNLRRWFARNLGLWRSRGNYFFGEDESLFMETLLLFERIPDNLNNETNYRFSWKTEKGKNSLLNKTSSKGKGMIELTLSGHRLKQSCSYIDSSPCLSSICQVDEHELIFETRIKKWHVIEHARLIDQDNYRSRNIYIWEDSLLKTVETLHETRLN